MVHLSHDLMISGSIPQHILKDLPLPDLVKNQKMIFSSCLLRTIVISFVPKAGTSLVVMGVTETMHGGQNRTTPDDGIRLEGSVLRYDVSSRDLMLIFS